MELKDKSNVFVTESGKLFLLHPAYIGTVNVYHPRIGTVQSTHYLKQSSLPRSTGSHDAYHFSLGYLQIYPFQYL